MLVVIEKVDAASNIIECRSAHGKMKGKWCTKPLPMLSREYSIEIDIPKVVTKESVVISTERDSRIETGPQSVLVSGKVCDQDDYSLTLQLGHDMLLVEVDFTLGERSLLNNMIDITAEQLNLYDTRINIYEC